MQYLLLIYDAEKNFEDRPEAEQKTIMEEYGVFTEGVRSAGQYVGGHALQPIATATTVRSGWRSAAATAAGTP